MPDAQAPLTAWLIDAVSGKAGALGWRDEPTTLSSPEQALVLCDESYDNNCFLPRVVDARDGTIRPSAMPDDAVSDLPVAQHGTDRIWVGTAPDGDPLGLAYSDDGGETWTEVALPERLGATSEELATSRSYEEKLLEIAADGDRVAVTFSWERETERDNVYVSDNAGRSWTTATPSEPGGNGAHLYVLADGRLILMWSLDAYPVQLLASAGADWAELEKVDAPHVTEDSTGESQTDFSVNRAGIAFSYSFRIDFCEAPKHCPAETEDELDLTIDFSTDMTNWWTIEGLDD